MTRGEIRTLARKRLGETTAAFWSDTELNDWIDDAGHDIAFKSKCIRTNGNITTVADTMEYTISDSFASFIAVLEVYMYQDAATWVRISQIDRNRLSSRHPGWKSAPNGVPDEYYWDREEDVIGIYPKPNSTNAGTDYLEVYYAYDYTDITGDAVTPANIPILLQKSMADFVVARGYESRGWGDKANDAWSKYNNTIRQYLIERDTEKQEDSEAIQMINYRNM